MDLSPRRTVVVVDPLSEVRELFDEFDQSSSHGLICKTCHVMVPAMSGHAKGHLEWHADQVGSR